MSELYNCIFVSYQLTCRLPISMQLVVELHEQVQVVILLLSKVTATLCASLILGLTVALRWNPAELKVVKLMDSF